MCFVLSEICFKLDKISMPAQNSCSNIYYPNLDTLEISVTKFLNY